MSKKGLKKEIKRLHKIIDVLLLENRGVYCTKSVVEPKDLTTESLTVAIASDDYIGGRPGDRG